MYSLTFVVFAFSVGYLVGMIFCFVALTLNDTAKESHFVLAEQARQYMNDLRRAYHNGSISEDEYHAEVKRFLE